MTSQTITPRSRYQPRVISKFQKVHPIGPGQGSVFGSEIDFATRGAVAEGKTNYCKTRGNREIGEM